MITIRQFVEALTEQEVFELQRELSIRIRSMYRHEAMRHPATKEECENYSKGLQITAIKSYRARTGKGLSESKNIIEICIIEQHYSALTKV